MDKIATTTSKGLFNSRFLGLDYWFSTPDPANFGQLTLLEGVSTIALLVVLGLFAFKLFSKINPPQNKFLNKAMVYLLAFGPLGWLLVFFRYLGIVSLSVRFLWLVWLASLLLVIGFLVRYCFKVLPSEEAKYQAYLLKKKYLPKRRK